MRVLVFASVIFHFSSSNVSAEPPTQTEAREALHKTVTFYRTNVGYQGAYLWRYSSDLTQQEGEGIATKTSGWTQPPGAPSVGEAYLKAWRLSGERVCLDAAVEVARALVRAQLQSGGWSSHFDLGAGRLRYAYRTNGEPTGRNNATTFDDDKSQSALMLLMHVDEALKFEDATIHEAVDFALKNMLAAQYPNGAWPQQFSKPPNAEQFPIKKACYPDTWPRIHPKQKYTGFYTLNDNNMSHIVDMLFEAQRIYERSDCFRAAVKTGDFFLLAQIPEPQPGWAQQYNTDMQPVWARKFEPAAVTGGESQGVMRTLLKLYRFTGQKKFIQTLPQAINYYRKSLLPNGQLARFYELKTNRPLYFTKDYELTYIDADMPTHYAFKVGSKLDSIEKEYRKLLATNPGRLKPAYRLTTPVNNSNSVRQRAAAVIKRLDQRGAWVEKGNMRHREESLDIIDMRTFARNLETLAACAGAIE